MIAAGIADALSVAAVLAALLFVAGGRKQAVGRDAAGLLVVLLLLQLLCYVSNALEWLDVTARFDPMETYVEVILPLVWGFFAYAFMQYVARRELRESEERNRILLASLPQRVFFKDAESVFVSVNERFARDFGLRPEDFVGKTDADLHPEELAAKYRADDRLMLESGRAETLIERNVIGGAERFVEVTKAPVKDDDGDVVGLVGLFTDITERVRAEEELRNSEAFLASVFASIQDGLTVLDTELNIVRVNPAMQQRHAHAMPLIGRKCYEVFRGRTDPCEACPSVRCLQTREAAHEVMPDLGPNGVPQGWLDLYSFPLFDRTANTVEGVIEVVRDITDRKRAEEALRASEEKYRLIIENATDVVTLHTVDELKYLYVNPATLTTLGYFERDLLGTSAADYIHPDDREPALTRYREAVEHGGGKAEFRFRKKDGSYVWLEATGKLTRDERGDEVMLVLSRDITERVQQREELRALSLQDPLTKANNRRGFFHLANQQLKFAQRTGSSLVLFFVDVDDMKWINDTLGHKEGDLALIETANVLRETFRESDIIGRVGGDEFAVLAIQAPGAQADDMLVRLQERLEARNVQPNRHFRLSFSVGITTYDPDEPLPLDELMAGADALMYEDKRAKRAKRARRDLERRGAAPQPGAGRTL